MKRKGLTRNLWRCLTLLAIWQVGMAAAVDAGPPATAPAKPPAVVSAATTVVPPSVAPSEPPYQYSPDKKSDPFKPFVRVDAAARKKAAQTKAALPLNPLQRLDVEQFRLVGVIESDRGRRAMVQDPSGKFYSLTPGSYIGLNKGRVSKILKDSIIVIEKIPTDEGKLQTRTQIRKLRQDEVKP